MRELEELAFTKAEISFNSIKRLVNSWVPVNATLSISDQPSKKPLSLYKETSINQKIKIGKLEREKEEREKSLIAMEEEEREMKSLSSKKRKNNDVLNVT